MRKPLVVGNWKMNLTAEKAMSLARSIAKQVDGLGEKVDVVLAPALPWLLPVEGVLGRSTHAMLGVQDADAGVVGAQTGSVSMGMLKPHASYVIIGHSERRLARKETHQTINAKIIDALKRGLTPIVCVGEFVHLYDTSRKRGRPTKLEAESNIYMQIRRALKDVPEGDISKVVVSYEPVWAIGTGEPADPAYVSQVVRKLRRTVARLGGKRRATRMRVLYGGSVTAKNARDYASLKEIDGVLVGAASLDAKAFGKIVATFADIKQS